MGLKSTGTTLQWTNLHIKKHGKKDQPCVMVLVKGSAMCDGTC